MDDKQRRLKVTVAEMEEERRWGVAVTWAAGVFDVAVGSELDDLGFGGVDGEHPAGGEAEGSAGFAEGKAAPAFGGHGAGVGEERQRFVIGRCAAAVTGRPRWALVPRQVDVQKPSNALYKAKAGLLFSIERFPR